MDSTKARRSSRAKQINHTVSTRASQSLPTAQGSNTMPEISSPDPPSAAASRMGSELPASRSIGAEEASLPDNPEDEERNGLEIASAALGQPEKMGEVPFYAGKGKTKRLSGGKHRNLQFEQVGRRGLLRPWIFALLSSRYRGIFSFPSIGQVCLRRTRNFSARKEYTHFQGEMLVKA